MSFLRQGSYRPGQTQNIITSAVSQPTSPVSSATSIVRVAVTEDTFVSLGELPEATVNSLLMPAGAIEFFAVTPGVTSVAFLQKSISGLASLTELATL
jgi:hypothetical protein